MCSDCVTGHSCHVTSRCGANNVLHVMQHGVPYLIRELQWTQLLLLNHPKRSQLTYLSSPLQVVATGMGLLFKITSKCVNLYAIPDQRSTTVAKWLFENFICEHGIPEMLHRDQGRQFELVKHLCQLPGIKKTRTSPHHPQCDGMIEKFNRTLIDQLAKTLLQQPVAWDDCLN